MDEYSNKEISMLDDNTYLKNKIISKKVGLKYYYYYLISIIISILCIIEHLITSNSLFNIRDNLRDNDDSEFNITNFYFTDDICENNENQIEISNYFININNFVYNIKIIKIIGNISFFTSIILLGNIYCIYNQYKRGREKFIKDIFFTFAFIIAVILFITQIVIFILYLYQFIRLYEIINFLEANKCFRINKLKLALTILKNMMKNISILAGFSICIIQVIIYFLKQIIIINDYFSDKVKIEKKQEEKKYSNININLSDVD